MNTKFLILGGGVGGLSAANRLADMGADVVLIEAGSYPAHKICGEFISPEALPILAAWDIKPAVSFDSATFFISGKPRSIQLPHEAAAISRYRLEEALALRATQKGAKIFTHSRVEKLHPPASDGEPFIVTLSSGEQWRASQLLLSSGRIAITSPQDAPAFRYIGVKAHFEGFEELDQLMMYLMPKAYFGIAPLGNGCVNVAGLIAHNSLPGEDLQEVVASFFKLPQTQPLVQFLSQGRRLFEKWLIAPVPEFGLRPHPGWPSTYLLGDAAGTIPPATGDGLAIGITSGILAAEYAWQGKADLYQQQWKREYAARIARGRLLHRACLSPCIAGLMSMACRLIPSLPSRIFFSTRGSF